MGLTERTVEDLFAGFPDSLALFRVVERAVHEVGEADLAVTKSQVAFRRRRGFAYVWRPGQYVHSDVPAVLSLALPHSIDSERFKSVVHVAPHQWMHHLELRRAGDVDPEVRGWIAVAYAHAGERSPPQHPRGAGGSALTG